MKGPEIDLGRLLLAYFTIRLGLSTLHSHKFNHNFLDTISPMCPINDGIEDIEHFLLKCHAYDDQRRDLFGAINEILQLHNIPSLPYQTLVRIILFGDIRFTHNQNRHILQSTLIFIHASEPFL